MKYGGNGGDKSEKSAKKSVKPEVKKSPAWAEQAKTLAKIPETVPYLIIGAGTAAFSAARSIRSRDPKAKIVVIGEESYSPYMRPPLSKELWLTPANDDTVEANSIEQPAFLQWSGRPRSVFLEKSQFYCALEELQTRENGGISIGHGLRVVSLNPRKQTVTVMPSLADIYDSEAPRREISYGKCLIATGGKPKSIPQFDNIVGKSENVTFYRNIDDFKKLTDTADRIGKSGTGKIVIVGGGFLGSELAFALAWRASQKGYKYKVSQVIRERGLLDHVLPSYLSGWTTDKLAEAGVEIVSAVDIKKVQSGNNMVKMTLSDGKELEADHVILATGIEPNTELAEGAGLEVDAHIGGIAVNSELLARNNIWAAGDVSSFYDPRLKARRRVEHHDQAIVSGRLAGENMAGANKVYSQQAMFWSDMGPNISFEAVGLVDASLQTFAVFAKPEAKDETKKEDFKKGVVFYMSNPKDQNEDRRLVGLLLWNLPGRLGLARRLLKDQPCLDGIDGGTATLTEMARIMQLNDDDAELAGLTSDTTDVDDEAEQKILDQGQQ